MEDQFAALSRLVAVTQGRVPATLTERAREVCHRTSRRLRLGSEAVVALAGATNSGRTSLIRALSGTDASQLGVNQPTATQPLAVSLGCANRALLDWLELPTRYETPSPTPGLESVVLVDLPSPSSSGSSDRDHVQRLLPLVDMLVWVMDPRRYADVVVHRDHLRPLAPHREVMAVVLNQVDLLRTEDLPECLSHLRQLLATDGLPGIPVFAVSAVTGQGLDELRGQLAALAARQSAARSRVAAELGELAEAFEQHCPEPGPTPSIDTVQKALEPAVGVSAAAETVGHAIAHHGKLATAWPLPGRWRRGRRGLASGPETGTSEPVAEAQLTLALRDLIRQAATGLPPGWRRALDDAVQPGCSALRADLDQAAATPVSARGDSWTYRLVRGLQWVILAAAVLGLGWSAINLLLGSLGLPTLWPHMSLSLLVVAATAAILTTGAAWWLVAWRAGRAADLARAELGRAVAAVGQRHVLGPMTAERERLAEARQLMKDLSA